MVTPNMNLTVPTVGTTPGPTYAFNVDNSFTLIDQHDHSPGKGVLITPSGMSISADLSFQSNNATGLRSVILNLNSSTLSSPIDIGNVYRVNGDLWYNNGSGTPVQITSGNSVVGTSGSISGLVSPASASYSGLTDTFIWQSNANTPANMNFGSATFGNINTSGFGVTVSPISSLGSSYSLILPALPASKKILTLDTSGNIVADYDVDNSTLTIISNVIQVKNGGINTAQLANGSVTTAKLASGVIQTHQQFTTSTTFTVPAGVNVLTWTYVGGGGGGGGGGGDFSNISGGGGGGGGVAGQVLTTSVPTTPSTVWTVTVGAGGTGGNGGVAGSGGAAGGVGGISTITDGSTFLVAAGGNPGLGGIPASSAPLQTGGNSGTILLYNNGFVFATGGLINSGGSASAGGNAPDSGTFGGAGAGGGGADLVAGGNGGSSLVAGGSGGAAGARSGGGGGGAGGSLFSDAAGGTGGNGATGGGSAVAGGNGTGHGSGGGGGGGAGNNGGGGGFAGANGGSGSTGVVIVFYQPST